MEVEKSIEELRKLEGKRLYGYSSGVLGQILPATLINAYLSIFYIYVVGLDAFLVGVGTALGSILNGICAPMFGFISDRRKPTKLGKRRPYLLFGLPGLILAFILIWLPPLPQKGDSWNYGVAIFLWVINAICNFPGPWLFKKYLTVLSAVAHFHTNQKQFARRSVPLKCCS